MAESAEPNTVTASRLNFEVVDDGDDVDEVDEVDDDPPVNHISWFNLLKKENEEERLLLLQRTGLLCAAYSDGNKSMLPIIDVDKATSVFSGGDLQGSESYAETVYTEREYTIIQKGWTEAAAEVDSPWLTASVQYRKDVDSGRTSKGVNQYSSATCRIQVYKIQATEKKAAQALSAEFLETVEEATNAAKPLVAVQAVFEDYGYLYPLTVEIGASITMSATQKMTEVTTNASNKTTLKAEVQLKYNAFAAGASFGTENEKETNEKIEEVVGSVEVSVKGGDTRLLHETKQWMKTTKDVNYLTVIGVFKVVPVTRLIELNNESIYKKIEAVLSQPLLGRWVPVKPQEGLHTDFTMHFGFPDDKWKADGWCLIGDSLASKVVLLVREAPGHEGALGPCTFNTKDISNITYMIGTPNEYRFATRQAVPTSNNYATLGAAIRRRELYQNGDPDNFRAVRKNLLVEANLGFERVTILEYKPPFEPAGYKIVPKDPKEGVDADCFWPEISGKRDTLLNDPDVPSYVLKKSEIKMENTKEDALKEATMY